MSDQYFQNILLLTLLCLHISYGLPGIITKPVIGIISTPSDFHDLYSPHDFSYIKGTYAEFVDAADGIPIGIPWDMKERELIKVLDSVNGILLTGGDAKLWDYNNKTKKLVPSDYTKRISLILSYAIKLNDEGIYFPVYGICQGHEVILLALTGRPRLIDHFVHSGQLDTVHITPEGKKSRMFGNMPDYLQEYLQDQRAMFYHHRYGFNTSLFSQYGAIDEFFTVTAKGIDDNNKEFIAAMEAKDYPIYTVQYHPERVFFEWRNKEHFDHPDESAQVVLIQAMFFISEAMKNQQKFYSEDALSNFLIDNHAQLYFNLTWPRVHLYDKKTPITFNINYLGYDSNDEYKYDCQNHDCSFIKDLPDLPDVVY